MKKFICGLICGMIFSIGTQSYARGKWNNPWQDNISIIGKTIDETNLKLDKIYSKLKSIDERLEIENNKYF